MGDGAPRGRKSIRQIKLIIMKMCCGGGRRGPRFPLILCWAFVWVRNGAQGIRLQPQIINKQPEIVLFGALSPHQDKGRVEPEDWPMRRTALLRIGRRFALKLLKMHPHLGGIKESIIWDYRFRRNSAYLETFSSS